MNRNFSKKISSLEEKPLFILEGIVARICEDLNSEPQVKNPSNTIIIVKCFNIIRTFVEQNNYILSFFAQIEKIIAPLYNYLERNNFEFVEDILAIILTQINKKQIISVYMEKILPIFQKIFERRKKMLGTLFQILNGYLVYGEAVFLNNSNNIEFVILIYFLL